LLRPVIEDNSVCQRLSPRQEQLMLIAANGDALQRCRLLLPVALALVSAFAGAAEFDNCVRGSSLAEVHTARLHLTVDGADVSAYAARLSAVIANRVFWQRAAEDVAAAPFDADLCGEAVAPTLQATIRIATADVAALAAEIAGGAGSGPMPTLDRVLSPGVSVRRDLVLPGEPAAAVGEAVLDPAGRLRYHLMRVYFATNRKHNEAVAPDEQYGGERGRLTFGVANVALPRTHEAGQLEAPSILRLEFSEDPDKHVVLQSATELAAAAWRAEVAKRATALGNPGILIFVHGYNSSFSDSARRAAQLAYDLKFAGSTVLFSWPSQGSTIEYTVDEQAAEWSIPDMKVFLASVATIAPGAPIYVVAHSMGNRVFARGFQALLAADRASAQPFTQLVMAAPDIDADVFRRDIGPAILGMGPRVTLYASSNDKALAASRSVHGGYRRLGESGADLVVLSGLDTVDASNVSTDFIGHSYYGDSGTVMADLMYVVRRRLPPEERERFALERVKDAALGLYWRFKSQSH
jgi:esterase/lipase superfamily enzyme